MRAQPATSEFALNGERASACIHRRGCCVDTSYHSLFTLRAFICVYVSPPRARSSGLNFTTWGPTPPPPA